MYSLSDFNLGIFSYLLDHVWEEVMQISTTAFTPTIRRIGDELWSCQRDGVVVLNSELEEVRRIGCGTCSSAALLDSGDVVCSTKVGLKTISKSGNNAMISKKEKFRFL